MTKICYRWTHIPLLIAAVLLLAPPATAQQPTLTLQQAVAAALQHNPARKLSAANLAVADAGYGSARAMLLPQISFSEGITRGDDPVYVFGTKLRQQSFQAADFGLDSLNRPGPLGNLTTEFSGRWVAFDSWHTELQIRRASLLKQSVGASSDRSSQEVIYGVIAAYEAVLMAQRDREVATHAVETAQALYDLSRSRVGAGLVVESDALSAQVHLAARQQELIQAQGDEQTAWAGLEAAAGIELPAGAQHLEPLAEHNFTLSTLQDELALALKNRPDLKSLALEISAQQSAVKSAKYDFGPRVETFASWRVDHGPLSGNTGNSWIAGAELRVDLLPLDKRERLQQEKAALLRAQAGEESARNLIRVEVSRAYYACQSAAKTIDVARASMAQATESLRILRNRYDAGLVTITEVLNAEDAERQSRKAYWQAVYRNALSYAALRLTTGTLDQDQVVNFQ